MASHPASHENTHHETTHQQQADHHTDQHAKHEEHGVISSLNWRYATKRFDPDKKLDVKELHNLLEALRLAPSSFGLQPWTFIVVDDPAVREKLKTAAWNQAQVTDASHLIVLCAKKTLTTDDVDHFMLMTAESRDVAVETLDGYKEMILGSVRGRSPEAMLDWNARQTYLALGTLLTACAVKHIDACPMEGFSAPDVDAILGLAEKGLTAVVFCAVGHRLDDDKYATMAKMRYPASEVIQTV